MRTNTYISIICILIVASVIVLKYIEFEKIKSKSEKPVTYSTLIANNHINESILIDDQEKPIQKPKAISAPKPYITAESYIVGNLETGAVYLSQNPAKVFPIASVSKLYTALVAHHLFDLEEKITITQTMLDTHGESGGFQLDEKFIPNELLHALLLVSSNDAAEAYAQSWSGGKFIEQMNAFAREIGMNNTSFKDASGLSSQNISNSEDLFILSKYLYKNERDILDISKTREIELATTTDHGYHHFVNINPYWNYADFIGGKTGRTEWAKEAMVSLFEQKVGDVSYPIAIVILRSDLGEREINTEKLLGMFMEKVKQDDIIYQ